MKLAIFGGTFDPVHLGHLALAGEAAERFQLDRILFVPAFHPPHKSGATHAAYEDRVRMLELACWNEPKYVVSRLEEGTERSYSIDTIEKVRATLSAGDELYFLIGADAFAEIRRWRRWRDVANLVRFLVASRPGHRYPIPDGAVFDRIDNLQMPESSSEIRRALAGGETPPGLPSAVLQYCVTHALYAA